jgi:hypothetical protein
MAQIHYKDGKKDYTLEYTLQTAGQCAKDGFVLSEITTKPAAMIPLLIHWAFVQHHRGITKSQTAVIYERMNHKQELLEQLISMYAEAVNALVDDDEDAEGNANWTLT